MNETTISLKTKKSKVLQKIAAYLICTSICCLPVVSNAQWTEGSKLLAEFDGAAEHYFGSAVDISGNTAIVGAYGDSDNGLESGSAYIFEKVGGAWTEVSKLLPSDGATGDLFGHSVSISGGIAIVGAFRDDDFGSNSGAAYVFENIGGTWAQVAKLTPNIGEAGAQFGYSVSISDSTAIIGANLDDEIASNCGAAFVFQKLNGTWSQSAKLTPADGEASDFFGRSLSISNNTIIVGASGNDDNGLSSGSAYIFDNSLGSWTQMAKLLPADGASFDYFGWSVAISEATAVIGSYFDDDNGSASGSAYLFDNSEGIWSQIEKLTAPDGEPSDYFGYSVDVSGDKVIVGAYGGDDNGDSSGSAYVFDYSGALCAQTAKLLATEGEENDYFGWTVAISDSIAFLGVFADDDLGNSSGSVYVYNYGPFAAPTNLSKSFNAVNGLKDRVQVKWYKHAPQVAYTAEDAAACDIKFWEKRNLDSISGVPYGPAIANPDTLLISDAKKSYPNNSPKAIFKWPIKFSAQGVNNTNRVNPNKRYEWKVRCACGHGLGVESPWSDVKVFNTPNFNPQTGIYTEFGSEVIDVKENKKTFANSEFIVFPNPNDGNQLFIQDMELSDIVELKVFNNLGQELQLNSDLIENGTSGMILHWDQKLPSGMYTLLIRNSFEQHYARFSVR